MPLAATLPSRISEEDLQTLRQLRENVAASEDADILVQNRTFGIGGAGHETIFLHDHLDGKLPHIRQHLKQLAKEAYAIAGWSGIPEVDLEARCLELIRYKGNNQTNDIGWHADGATLLTMAVMLSKLEEYSGGQVELRQANNIDADERYELSFGQAIAWRGWTNHRVSPVTSGLREVFVVEWWLDADCSVTRQPRADDSVEGVRRALQLDDTSANLNRWLGELLCDQLPCRDDIEAEAEAAFRRAQKLAAKEATATHALGNFLIGSEGVLQRAEGLRYLRHAHALDPTVARPPPPELGDVDVLLDKAWHLGCVVLFLALLMPLLMFLERRDKASAKTSATPVAKQRDTVRKTKKS